MQQPLAEDTISHLDRLSQKPGVQSTLVISRDSGVIVQSSGLDQSTEPTNGLSDVPVNGGRAGAQTAEDVAKLVYHFVRSSGDLLKELNGTEEDDLKLLRLRTGSKELVIVPDAKYIAVVIHSTPPA